MLRLVDFVCIYSLCGLIVHLIWMCNIGICVREEGGELLSGFVLWLCGFSFVRPVELFRWIYDTLVALENEKHLGRWSVVLSAIEGRSVDEPLVVPGAQVYLKQG